MIFLRLLNFIDNILDITFALRFCSSNQQYLNKKSSSYWYLLIIATGIILIITAMPALHCADFLEEFYAKKFGIQVSLIKNIVENVDTAENLIAIKRCIISVIPPVNSIGNLWVDDFSSQPMLADSIKKPFIFNSICLWLFLSIISIILSGFFVFLDVFTLDFILQKNHILCLFEQISSDPVLINELYEILVKTKIIID